MSALQYNGVSLSLIQTTAFSHETLWTDDHADYLGTHIHLEVHAVFNSALPPSTSIANAAPGLTVTTLRELLAAPRQHLYFSDGVNTLVEVTGVTHTGVTPISAQLQNDIRNGPFPQVLSITQINPATTYLIVFAIDTYIDECIGGTVPFILSHRWVERLGYDDKFARTYSRMGRIYAKAVPPPQPTFRDGLVYTQVPLRDGFRRDASDYTLSSDGLSLEYSVKDVEVHRQAPPPATRADGWAIATLPKGAVFELDVTVHLWGPPGGAQGTLLVTAIIVAVAKMSLPLFSVPQQAPQGPGANFPAGLGLAVAGGGLVGIGLGILAAVKNRLNPNQQGQAAQKGDGNVPPVVLSGGAMRHRLYDNEVEVNLHAICVPPAKTEGTGSFANVLAFLGRAPAYSPVQGPGPLPLLSSVLPLWAAELADPCLQSTVQKGLIPGGDSQLKTAPNAPLGARLSTLTQATLKTVAALPSQGPTDLYAALPGGIYTDYEIRTYHRTLTTIEQLPTAAPSGFGQSVASIVQIADPVTDLVVEWTAECVWKQPAVPDWDLQDDNAFLVDRQVHTHASKPQADGQAMATRISGKYVYALKDYTQDVLVSGLFPWLDKAAGPTAVLNPDVFQQGILTNTGQGGQEVPKIVEP